MSFSRGESVMKNNKQTVYPKKHIFFVFVYCKRSHYIYVRNFFKKLHSCIIFGKKKKTPTFASVLILHRYQTHYSASSKKFLKSSSSEVCVFTVSSIPSFDGSKYSSFPCGRIVSSMIFFFPSSSMIFSSFAEVYALAFSCIPQ